MRTVYLNASYFPAVELLSAIGTAVILLYGGYQVIDGKIADRRPGRVRRLPEPVLRPDPADLAALHDLPAGDGGARQDLRPARHRARHDRQAGRDRPGRDPRRDAARGRVVLLQPASGPWALDGHRPRRRPRARRWRWSARPAPASRRWRSWSRASTTRSGAACSSTGTTCATCRRGRCAASSGSCRRRASCSRARSGRTSRSAAPTRATRTIVEAARTVGADGVHRPAADGLDTEVGERGVAALGRAAPARRLRAGAAGRAADPDPRRGDLERRRPDRARDRARARAAAARAHRDRDRPPAVDDQARGPDRRARARADRRVGHARRADRGGRRYAGLYGAWADQQAA